MKMGPLMLDLEGTLLSDADIRRIQHPAVGGVILFSRNIESFTQVQELISSVRAIRSNLILAVDQEGGRVQRFKEGVTQMLPLSHLGELYDVSPEPALQVAKDWGWLMASEMLAMGLDISFAPVLDLNIGRSQVIGDRAFHGQPDKVANLGKAYIQGMHEAGMAATGKHFPGHGWAEADSHLAIPEDDRDWETIEQCDLVPFKMLSAHLDAVMPAHVIYSKLDSHPAGFSPFWLQTVLRQKLGFNGVIFSDDLSMAGASVAGGYPERVAAALSAGCDMVLVCNNSQAANAVLAYLETCDPNADQDRLENMLAKTHLTWSELAANERYFKTKLAIHEMGGVG